jgi:hypothetical protein
MLFSVSSLTRAMAISNLVPVLRSRTVDDAHASYRLVRNHGKMKRSLDASNTTRMKRNMEYTLLQPWDGDCLAERSLETGRVA